MGAGISAGIAHGDGEEGAAVGWDMGEAAQTQPRRCCTGGSWTWTGADWDLKNSCFPLHWSQHIKGYFINNSFI